MAPFNKEFYLTIGIGVGGFNDFPDDYNIYNGQKKPWVNRSVKALKNFWITMESKKSWPGERSQLHIDYVKVYAV